MTLSKHLIAKRKIEQEVNIVMEDMGLCFVSKFCDGEQVFYAISPNNATYERRVVDEDKALKDNGYTLVMKR